MCMQKKYTISLIGVLVAILSCIMVYFEYQTYLRTTKNNNGAITLVSEELSINYLDGNVVSINDTDIQNTFSITNHSDEIKYYFIRISNISGDISDVTYQLSSSNEDFQLIENNFNDQLNILRQYAIKPSETHRYTLRVLNAKRKDFSFQIEIDNENVDDSFQSVLLNKNAILEDDDVRYEENSSISGLFRRKEQFGDLYYFRGNVENNYVSLAGLLWRIVKINEDGTVKIVLNDATENMEKINENGSGTSFDFYTSHINNYLEEWYNVHLKDFDSLISSTKYCYDDSIVSDEFDKIWYLSNIRLLEDYHPINICSGTTISKKIALLTADEVMFAGVNKNENKAYYLYNESIQRAWWTMTPSKMENNTVSFYVVGEDGSLKNDNETTSLFSRPAITLIKKVKVIGEGTKDNPYTVSVN